MASLHPVKWSFERLASDDYYAYGFGGGLADPVTSESYPTRAEALRDLCGRLRKLGRVPEYDLAEPAYPAGPHIGLVPPTDQEQAEQQAIRDVIRQAMA